MLNKTQIKAFVHEHELKFGRDVLSSLEQRLLALLNDGIERAKRNQRKTLLGRDL
jgi:hypothetical protein